MPSTPAIVYASRISDSETMTNKLIYQIRSNQLSNTDLDKLQSRCTNELADLRQELDEMLRELRQIAAQMNQSEIQQTNEQSPLLKAA
ncbi:hypothetical protein [Paenibacillus sp. MMS18-CY102]|uniref:hypothetical protein n=1 Tax=Paenibacillus sp. MMS18-CY102 TaxID=2682849 RepID=UPI001365304A|nr:hypothetical protein [Paenibacillus sp. MMS18-CY102]MWC28061.1 hypothetical protein [Paenibacillus sp. MMS18-CY102]